MHQAVAGLAPVIRKRVIVNQPKFVRDALGDHVPQVALRLEIGD